ncbi:Pyruvate kinase [uncultured Alphaproteobacteria bacterium]|uniref:Pyruvate kinase n=1 Tax=uncultured Alphaproteobacteria bacterium TaxID=91750 RepID=A0A212JFL4_9PROT|nr:Pyruvate kinase [uncultured Alphaproteobacteria bacterium]
MRRYRHAKILATLGPASSTEEAIEALFLAGADVFRLNFSHGTQDDHRARFETIRSLARRLKRPIGILADLQGPKLRIGTFPEGKVQLEAGQPFRLDLEDAPGSKERVRLPHPEIFEALVPGTHLLLDDGRIRLAVTHATTEYAETEVITAGTLSDRKGVNVPGVTLDISPLTKKDRADLAFALDLGVDWVALSFVQRPDDVSEIRKIVDGAAGIVAKLEKPSALEHLEAIVELSDAVMVARGDLGVEIPPERVPMAQKRIISACRGAGKPVIVATQMLESMITAPAPTRAEASDVATAVYDGADAVMLSAETASGAYPVLAVEMMDRIIAAVETDPQYEVIVDASHRSPEATSADAISAAARQVAQTLGAQAIATFTHSGSTTLRAARERPMVPILCLTPNLDVARRLSLAWGVHAVIDSGITSFTEAVQRASHVAIRDAFAQPGERLVVTAGVPFGRPGTTNSLRVAFVEDV